MAGAIRRLGHAPLVLPGTSIPSAHWYLTRQGVVVGVGAHQVLESGGTVEVTSGQALASVVEAAAFPMRLRFALDTPWELPHDFRKAAAEVTTTSRLLSELSVLLAVLVDSEEQGADYSQLTERRADGSLQIRATLITHLFRGRSFHEFLGAATLRTSTLQRELLIFETLEVSIESPFFSKLKPYIKWDKKVSIATLIAAITLFGQLEPGGGHPVTPDGGTTQISCGVETVSPSPSRGVYAQSCREYQRELRDGGVKAAQQYLRALGYDPGASDGLDGTTTQRAVANFCEDQGVVCTGTNPNPQITQAVRRLSMDA